MVRVFALSFAIAFSVKAFAQEPPKFDIELPSPGADLLPIEIRNGLNLENLPSDSRSTIDRLKQQTSQWKDYVSVEDQELIGDLRDRSSDQSIEEMAKHREQDSEAQTLPGYDYVIASTWKSLKGDFHTLRAEADNRRVGIVLRGLPKGMGSLREMAAELKDHIGLDVEEPGKIPGIQINPKFFVQHRIEVAPTFLVLSTMKSQREFLRATGVSSPRWMDEQLVNGQTGDLGKWGQVHLIEEQDLKEHLLEKIKAVDWEQQFQNAREGFWDRQKWIALPTTEKSTTRTIDPTYVVSQDIRDKDGEILVPAGTTYNPLHHSPFTTKLIIFNPDRPAELDIAIAEGKKHTRVKYLVNELPGERSFRSFHRLQNQVGAKVFLLSEAIATRFEIRATPSLVEAVGEHYQVTELSPDTP